MKKIKLVLFALAVMLFIYGMFRLATFKVSEEDVLKPIYNINDLAVINTIIDNNGLNWPKADSADDFYAIYSWFGAEWSDDVMNKRIEKLYLSSGSVRDTEVIIPVELSNGGIYSTETTLNDPDFSKTGISYQTGILTIDDSIFTSDFTVQTNKKKHTLSGTIRVVANILFKEEVLADAQVESSLKNDTYSLAIQQFFEDANIPEELQEYFTKAIKGDEEAREFLDKYKYGDEYRSIVTIKDYVISANSKRTIYTENAFLYNIGEFYYNGNDYVEFKQDKAKAYTWLKLSAEKGNIYGAIWAGDIARDGDGIPVDEQSAYELYYRSIEILANAEAYDRLGDCYKDGIGTDVDIQKAYDNYLDSALLGFPAALYKLSFVADGKDVNMTALYKAASSRNRAGYFDISYGGLEGYTANSAKHDMIDKLLNVWEKGEDPCVINMQRTIAYNDIFTKKFVTELMQTIYSYSYHAFVEKYGLQYNRTHADAGDIRIQLPEDHIPGNEISMAYGLENQLEYGGIQYYEYDFDGDGIDEICVPINSGAGGAFQMDNLFLYKKNSKGLYEPFSVYSLGALNDGMRLIRYDDRIYAIANPFSATGNFPDNIIVATIDKNGGYYFMEIGCIKYYPQHVITHTDIAYADGYETLFSEIRENAESAIFLKFHHPYYPATEKRHGYEAEDDLWDNVNLSSPNAVPSNAFFIADINNDGIEWVIHKGRAVSKSKYYDDFRWFQIYEGNDFETAIVKPEFEYDGTFGLHSKGNIYDIFPITNNVVEFWTHKYNEETYCITLQRYGLLYTMRVFKMENNEVTLIMKSLYIDEATRVENRFYIE